MKFAELDSVEVASRFWKRELRLEAILNKGVWLGLSKAPILPGSPSKGTLSVKLVNDNLKSKVLANRGFFF